MTRLTTGNRLYSRIFFSGSRQDFRKFSGEVAMALKYSRCRVGQGAIATQTHHGRFRLPSHVLHDVNCKGGGRTGGGGNNGQRGQVQLLAPGPSYQRCVLQDARRKHKLGKHKLDLSPLFPRNLRGTEIVGQDLGSANFSKCNLAGVRLEDCSLVLANFRGASPKHAYIIGCNIKKADFTDAIVNELSDGTRGGTVLSGKQLRTTKSFKVGDLVRVIFYRVNLDGFDLSGKKLSHTVFAHTDVRHVDFKNAVITGADLSTALNLTAEQIRSTWNFQYDHLKSVKLPPHLTQPELRDRKE